MIAVGLDLSLTSTGWAVWDRRCGRVRTDLVATRHIKGHPVKRRRYIAEGVGDAIHAIEGEVLVVIEKSFVSHAVSKQTAMDLASLHAVVLDHLPWQVVGIAYCTPGTTKKHLSGKGGADKDQMIAAAQACGYKGDQTDEADAYGLALLGHHLLGGTDHLTPHRASCLAAVEWLVPLPEEMTACP